MIDDPKSLLRALAQLHQAAEAEDLKRMLRVEREIWDYVGDAVMGSDQPTEEAKEQEVRSGRMRLRRLRLGERHDKKADPPGTRYRDGRLFREMRFTPATDDDRKAMTRTAKSLLLGVAGRLIDPQGRRLSDRLKPILDEVQLKAPASSTARANFEAAFQGWFDHPHDQPFWALDLAEQLDNNALWLRGEAKRLALGDASLPPPELAPDEYGAIERVATGAQILRYLRRHWTRPKLPASAPPDVVTRVEREWKWQELPDELTEDAIDRMIEKTGVNAGGAKKVGTNVVAEFLAGLGKK